MSRKGRQSRSCHRCRSNERSSLCIMNIRSQSRLITHTGREHIHARTVVGEVGALITEGRCAHSDSLLSSSGRVVACVLVVVAFVDR